MFLSKREDIKLPLMLHISLWIFSMYSRKDGSSNEETFQQQFYSNSLVSWSMLSSLWIFLSLIFKDLSMKDDSWEWTSSSYFFLIWSTSWSWSGDGEDNISSCLSDTRSSYSCLWEFCLSKTFSNMISRISSYSFTFQGSIGIFDLHNPHQ